MSSSPNANPSSKRRKEGGDKSKPVSITAFKIADISNPDSSGVYLLQESSSSHPPSILKGRKTPDDILALLEEGKPTYPPVDLIHILTG